MFSLFRSAIGIAIGANLFFSAGAGLARGHHDLSNDHFRSATLLAHPGTLRASGIEIADTLPVLARVDPGTLGAALLMVDGRFFLGGDIDAARIRLRAWEKANPQ